MNLWIAFNVQSSSNHLPNVRITYKSFQKWLKKLEFDEWRVANTNFLIIFDLSTFRLFSILYNDHKSILIEFFHLFWKQTRRWKTLMVSKRLFVVVIFALDRVFGSSTRNLLVLFFTRKYFDFVATVMKMSTKKSWIFHLKLRSISVSTWDKYSKKV